MRLQKLAGLERQKIEDELKAVQLSSKNSKIFWPIQRKFYIIKTELGEIRDKIRR
jgi:DNA gyrase/topoisomerase IV subunit A